MKRKGNHLEFLWVNFRHKVQCNGQDEIVISINFNEWHMAESLVHILKFSPSGLTKEAVYNDHNYKFLKLIINFFFFCDTFIDWTALVKSVFCK